MDTIVKKLEAQTEEWLKKVPHLPRTAQQWLGENAWWIVLISAISAAIGLIVGLRGLSILLSPAKYYGYVLAIPHVGLSITIAIINLAFLVVTGLLAAFAVRPLKDMKRRGWTLLFITLIVYGVRVVANAVLDLGSLNVFGFFSDIIFGAIALAIAAYFTFEVRGSFVHATRTPRDRHKS